MAAPAPRYREEQILIICPGSSVTMAQLGCHELTPPSYRIPTRMFPDQESGGWRPSRTFKRQKSSSTTAAPSAPASVAAQGVATAKAEAAEFEWVEDPDSVVGAVYPIVAGQIKNMRAFLAFLDYVHGLLTTTYHNTPIIVVASPQWTRSCCESITRYLFERTHTPALCLLHSAIATQWGLKWPHMTVVDIGFMKVDVTAIFDGAVVAHRTVGNAGGEIFTRALLRHLAHAGFTHDMAEQLKRSAICEVLPYDPDGTGGVGILRLHPTQAAVPPTVAVPVNGEEDEEDFDGADKADNDGVLDVASIVASGQTKQFLAKKDKEKQKAKLGKKGKDVDLAGASNQAKQANWMRETNTFSYEAIVEDHEGKAGAENDDADEGEDEDSENEDGKLTTQPRKEEQDQGSEGQDKRKRSTQHETGRSSSHRGEKRFRRVRRDVVVGLERFTFAEREHIDRIVEGIYETIQGVSDLYMRPPCWESLVFVGNGARLRGLRENIMQTLQARHLISPSSATIFTSELPSNLATPSGTGSLTPTGSFSGAPHQLPFAGTASSGGVNPLLQAATTASATLAAGGAPHFAGGAGGAGGGNPVAGPTSEQQAFAAPSIHFHSQTPTAIRAAQLPTYLSAWNKNGLEEAMFLGAQVAARVAFCSGPVDPVTAEFQRQMSISRVDYNEFGPKMFRTHSLLR